MKEGDEEQQNEEYENEEQHNEVECCKTEDDLLFDWLLEDETWFILIFYLFYLLFTFATF